MFLAKYNQTKTIRFRLFQVDGIDFEPAATFATGDIKIMKDEGTEANTTNLPTDEGQGYSLVLTATELSAARVEIYIVDQTATKIWLDTGLTIETYGNASAEHAFDLDTESVPQTGDSFPLVGNISSGSAAISTVAASVTVTTGTPTGALSNSNSLDGVLYEIADVANSTQFYFEFNVGGNGVPVEFLWDGYAQSNGDSYAVKAYNWVGAAFEQIGTISGTNATTIVSNTFQATNSHVGTGADIGKVRLEFSSSDGTHFATDRVLCSYAVVAQSVGYALGRVWVNTANGTAGTENYVNGTADNPVLTFADALTIADSLKMRDLNISSDSAITLAANLNDYNIYGVGWELATGGFDCGGTHFYHSSPTNGTVLAATGHVDLLDAVIQTMTCNEIHYTNCSFTANTVTFGAVAGDIKVIGCRSVVAGSGTPIFDFGTSSGIGHNMTVADWQNGIEIRNFNNSGADLFSISGTGQLIIAASCVGGTMNIRGQWKITDNSGGAVTIVYDAVVTMLNDIPTTAEFETRTPTANQLLYMTDNSKTGVPITVTSGTTTTVTFFLVDGAAASSVDNQYNGRLLAFNNSTLKDVFAEITDYVGSTKTATISAVPTTVLSSHTARMI